MSDFRTDLIHSWDAMQPIALRVIDAVHNSSDDDAAAEFLDAIAEAEKVGGPYWRTTLVFLLAALVPQDRSIGDLLAWAREGRVFA